MKGHCEICETEIDIQMCCSSANADCGCMGMPVEPPVCSEKCYNKYMERFSSPTRYTALFDSDDMIDYGQSKL